MNIQNTIKITNNMYSLMVESIANEVYREIGAFMPENIYREGMIIELINNHGYIRGKNLQVKLQVPIKYKNDFLPLTYYHMSPDMILDDNVIVLIKCIPNENMDKAIKECNFFMKQLNKKKGYIVNFPEKEENQIFIKEIVEKETVDETIMNALITNKDSINSLMNKIESFDYENIKLQLSSLEKSVEMIKNQLNNMDKKKDEHEKANIVLLMEEEQSEAEAEDQSEEEAEDQSEAEAEDQSEAEAEDQSEAEAEDQSEAEAEDQSEAEAEEEAEAEDQSEAEAEEEEEEELFEIEIDDITYCTNNEENGIIYEVDKDGSVGKQVGYLKEGEPFFT
jgi:GxxExxY protein